MSTFPLNLPKFTSAGGFPVPELLLTLARTDEPEAPLPHPLDLPDPLEEPQPLDDDEFEDLDRPQPFGDQLPFEPLPQPRVEAATDDDALPCDPQPLDEAALPDEA